MKERGDQNVQVLRRTMRLLECFSRAKPEIGLLELSQALDLPKSTVHRLLVTLQQDGYIVQNPETLRYGLSVKVLRLADAVVHKLSLEQAAAAALERLACETACDAHIAVLDRSQGEVVYLKTVSPMLPLVTVGTRAAVHSSALGKVLVAHVSKAVLRQILETRGMPASTHNTITDSATFAKELESVRRLGYAVDNEELKPGWSCVAAPVQDYSGDVLAAISLSGPSYMFASGRASAVAHLLCQAANEVSREIGCAEEHLIRYCAEDGERVPAAEAAEQAQ